MASDIRRIDARQLKAQLHDGGEIALLDAREAASVIAMLVANWIVPSSIAREGRP